MGREHYRHPDAVLSTSSPLATAGLTWWLCAVSRSEAGALGQRLDQLVRERDDWTAVRVYPRGPEDEAGA